MRTTWEFRNQGAAGPGWSKLLVENAANGYPLGVAVLSVDGGRTVVLKPGRIRKLMAALDAILASAKPSAKREAK